MAVTRERKSALGRWELLAIALGGMVGGGIFSILGVSVANIGNLTPVAIALGGVMALVAAYSYVQLAKLYHDEGATYSFFRRSFPDSRLAASAVGWIVTFGYISTLALYAFTFGSYFTSLFEFDHPELAAKVAAGAVLALFATVNLVSVRGMGSIEDVMVYTKLVLLALISVVLMRAGSITQLTPLAAPGVGVPMVLMTAAVTFVAFEGFQLAIHATEETANPDRDIPWAIYMSIAGATLIYVLMSIGALAALPKQEIIANKEFALAAGAEHAMGRAGSVLVVAGAVLATCSAISGTIFGASRLLAVIAADGYFPATLAKRRRGHIPTNAILVMTATAFGLVALGGLEQILEFGSITFIIASLLIAWANLKMRKQTHTHGSIAAIAVIGLGASAGAILYYQWSRNPWALAVTLGLYFALTIGAAVFARRAGKRAHRRGRDTA